MPIKHVMYDLLSPTKINILTQFRKILIFMVYDSTSDFKSIQYILALLFGEETQNPPVIKQRTSSITSRPYTVKWTFSSKTGL